MRCSNCGKDIPFAGQVCPYCHANKSKDQNLTVFAFISGFGLAIFVYWITQNIFYAFFGLIGGVIIGTILFLSAQQKPTNKKELSSIPSNSNENFKLILNSCGPRKIEIVKIICDEYGLGLAEAKALTDNPNSTLPKWLDQQSALRIKAKLEQTDAFVTLETR